MNRCRALFIVALGAAAGLSGAFAAGLDINNGRWVATGGFHDNAAMACAQCHELDGSGDSSGAFPRLSDQSAWYLYKTLKDFAAGLRPNDVMQAVAITLTDAQMADVSAYYAAIEDAPYPPPPEVDQRVLQIGGAIAAVGVPDRGVPACNACHGDDGVGSPPIYPYLAGQFSPYMEHQLKLWKNGQRGGDPLNIMEFIARNMTDDQIRAVALYFASLRPREVTPSEDAYLSLEEVAEEAVQGSAPPGPTFAPAETVGTDRARDGVRTEGGTTGAGGQAGASQGKTGQQPAEEESRGQTQQGQSPQGQGNQDQANPGQTNSGQRNQNPTDGDQPNGGGSE